MGKKLDKLVARIETLEKALAAMLTGKKPAKKSARRKSKKAAPRTKAAAKKSAAKRKKAKPLTPPLPLAGTL